MLKVTEKGGWSIWFLETFGIEISVGTQNDRWEMSKILDENEF